MAEQKIFAGPRIRRIRSRMAMTQAAMAERLDISASYLNLIESNQRPLTTQLVLKIISAFDVAPEDLQPLESGGSLSALREVFADPLLERELPGNTELMELSDAAPNAALAMVKLHRAYKEQQERLTDLSKLLGEKGRAMPGQGGQLPFDQVRQTFESVPWCFPALERAAKRILDVLEPHQGRLASLYALLRRDHGISVQVLPYETMPVWKKRFDRHSNRLFISERLSRPDRAELIVQELVLLREADVLDEEVSLLKVEGDEARRLARTELARYTALAVLMPYERFQRAAERTAYDLNLLATRYETGIRQVVERLVSLQDKSSGRKASLPFFALEVDATGTELRKIGAKGFPSARFGGGCAKLALFRAFAHPNQIVSERVVTPDGDVYLIICTSLQGVVGSAGEKIAQTSLLLGVEDLHAKAVMQAAEEPRQGTHIVERDDLLSHSMVHARLLPPPEVDPPMPIGPACRLCEREDCVSRSSPPLTRPLGLDDLVQGFGVFGLT